MDDLVERIKASLENRNGDLWFPDLTADLTSLAWDKLRRDIGLSPDSYATNRVLCRNVSASPHIIESLQTWQSAVEIGPPIAVEALSEEWSTQYRKAGVTFYSSIEVLDSKVLACLEEALVVLNQVPSLMRTVAALVRSLHVIKQDDAHHDVSFSEPEIPFSIFISVPEERFANGTLRVAEAIVHEAMHLQLTFVHQVLPLVSSMSGVYYSPWRNGFRNAVGILHALFVFGTIHRFLSELLPMKIGHANKSYINRRRCEITNQICQIRSFRDSAELTKVGSKLAARIIGVDEHKPNIRSWHQ